jgi:hypothetical protein
LVPLMKRFGQLVVGLAVWVCLCGFGGNPGSGGAGGGGTNITAGAGDFSACTQTGASLNCTVVNSQGNALTSSTFGASLNLGTNTSISASNITTGVLPAANGGTGAFTPEAYGAVHNLVIAYDATMPAIPTASTTSTTPQAPASIATSQNNEFVVSIINPFATLTPPGTPTQRALTSDGGYNIYVGDQAVPTAGTTVAAQVGSSASAEYISGTIGLVPVSGQTITFGNFQHAAFTAASHTVPKPTGLAQGQFEIFCAEWFNGSNTATPPTQFAQWVIFTKFGSDNSEMQCYGHFAGASEPATYSWSQANGADGATISVWSYSNVLTVDDPFTVTANNFSAGDVGKLITAESLNETASSPVFKSPAFGSIVGYNSVHNVLVSGFSNPTGSALAGTAINGEYHYGSDDKTPLINAYNACVSAGGGQVVLANSYASSDGIPLQSTVDCDIIGTKGLMPWFYVYTAAGGSMKCGTSVSASNPICNGPFGTSIGSGIDFISDTMTNHGLNLSNAAGTVPDQNVVKIENLTLWHGAGLGIRTDGNIDGIDTINVGGIQLLRNNVLGFPRDGIRYGDAGATAQSFSINGYLLLNHVDLAGEYNINIAGNEDVQNTTLINNEVEGANLAGLKIALGTNGGSFLAEDNTVQWDDQSVAASNPEILVSGTTPGCKIEGTWIEDPHGNGAFQQTGSGSTIQGCSFVNNNGTFITTGTITLGSASHIFTKAQVNGNFGFPVPAGVFDNNVNPGKAPGISGGGALSTGSNSFSGRITGLAATSNVLTPGFTCPNAVTATFQDDTTAGGVLVTGQSATTVTFSATAADTADYTASCR